MYDSNSTKKEDTSNKELNRQYPAAPILCYKFTFYGFLCLIRILGFICFKELSNVSQNDSQIIISSWNTNESINLAGE